MPQLQASTRCKIYDLASSSELKEDAHASRLVELEVCSKASRRHASDLTSNIAH